MALTLSQSAYAVAARCPASFLGVGGTEPYMYEVLPGGAGGTIGASSGAYTAPVQAASEGATLFDTIQVTDYAAVTATATIMVGSPLLLFCDILQRELGLADGRVYLWNQKIMQPSDNGLYIAVSVLREKPFSNVNRFNGETNSQEQTVNLQAHVDVDVISRGPVARDRKAEVLMAFASIYGQQQQVANSFSVSQLSREFLDLSHVDGAAIPYRYKIQFSMQYAYVKTQAAQFYDTFEDSVTADP